MLVEHITGVYIMRITALTLRLNAIYPIMALLFACSEKAEVDSAGKRHQHLCEIYTQTLGSESTPSLESSFAIAKRTEEELPSLTEDTNNWSLLPAEEVYPTVKKAAESELGQEWNCPAIRSFYESKSET